MGLGTHHGQQRAKRPGRGNDFSAVAVNSEPPLQPLDKALYRLASLSIYVCQFFL